LRTIEENQDEITEKSKENKLLKSLQNLDQK